MKIALRPHIPVNWRVNRIDGITYTENPKIEKMVFICGLHRSGTTLLERLISSHFDVSYLRMSVEESEGQHAQSVYSPANRFGGPGKFALNASEQQELLQLKNFSTYNDKIMRDWKRYVVGKSNVLVEKSPPNLTKMWWLRRVFENPKFIVLTRDPRATSVATEKWSGTSHSELMDHWHAAYSVAHKDMDPSDTIHVSYEEICKNHHEVLVKLDTLLGLQKRSNPSGIEARFSTLKNSNHKYIERFNGEIRADGIWNAYGYSIS